MKIPPEHRAKVVEWCLRGETHAEKILGQSLWDIPRRIHRLLDEPGQRLIVYGCHSCSKTHTGIANDLGFVTRHPAGRVIAIAPTGPQLTEIYWAEAHRQHREARIPLLPPIHRRELVWPGNPGRGIIGVATDQPTRIRGKKGRPLRLHIEEINGVREDQFDDIWSLMSQGGTQLYATMNPTLAAGPAYEMVAGDSGLYTVIRITAWDTPNLKLWGRERDEQLDAILSADPRKGGPLDTKVAFPWLISPRFIRDTYDLVSGDMESAIWKSRIEAEFPEEHSDTLLRLAWLESATKKAEVPREAARLIFSVDPAGRGGDECTLAVIAVWWDGPEEFRAVIDQQAWMEDDPRPKVAAHILGHYTAAELLDSVCVVDQGGLGHHWPKDLRALKVPNVVGIDYGGAADDPSSFVNRKAELFTRAAELFEAERIRGLQRGSPTFAQLASIRRRYDNRLRIGIEEKTGKSPDRAEAILQGAAWPMRQRGATKVPVAINQRRNRR